MGGVCTKKLAQGSVKEAAVEVGLDALKFVVIVEYDLPRGTDFELPRGTATDGR